MKFASTLPNESVVGARREGDLHGDEFPDRARQDERCPRRRRTAVN
ncbi:hypothetical protein Spb1_03430 [Planctopirus ephydatiae]|uniref:Uncharacterized protein n=1 Tax=Planctopirus ephydatiae TaxID=2528019 RepID=A0A518GIV6_9PLAN|nr:hypothetical protein Spb1_03430 [Planctopirus ephydatiae]